MATQHHPVKVKQKDVSQGNAEPIPFADKSSKTLTRLRPPTSEEADAVAHCVSLDMSNDRLASVTGSTLKAFRLDPHLDRTTSYLITRRPCLHLVVLFAGDQKMRQYSDQVVAYFLSFGVNILIQREVDQTVSGKTVAQFIRPEMLVQIIACTSADFFVCLGDRNMKNDTCQARRNGKLVEMNVDQWTTAILAEFRASKGESPLDEAIAHISKDQSMELLQAFTGRGHLKDRMSKLKLGLDEVRGSRNVKGAIPSSEDKVIPRLMHIQNTTIRLHRDAIHAVRCVSALPVIPASASSRQTGLVIGSVLNRQDTPANGICAPLREKLLTEMDEIVPKIEFYGNQLSQLLRAACSARGVAASPSLWEAYMTSLQVVVKPKSAKQKEAPIAGKKVDVIATTVATPPSLPPQPLGEDQWSCSACTFINQNDKSNSRCVICTTEREAWSVSSAVSKRTKKKCTATDGSEDSPPFKNIASIGANSDLAQHTPVTNLPMAQPTLLTKSAGQLQQPSQPTQHLQSSQPQQQSQRQHDTPSSKPSPSTLPPNSSSVGRPGVSSNASSHRGLPSPSPVPVVRKDDSVHQLVIAMTTPNVSPTIHPTSTSLDDPKDRSGIIPVMPSTRTNPSKYRPPPPSISNNLLAPTWGHSELPLHSVTSQQLLPQQPQQQSPLQQQQFLRLTESLPLQATWLSGRKDGHDDDDDDAWSKNPEDDAGLDEHLLNTIANLHPSPSGSDSNGSGVAHSSHPSRLQSRGSPRYSLLDSSRSPRDQNQYPFAFLPSELLSVTSVGDGFHGGNDRSGGPRETFGPDSLTFGVGVWSDAGTGGLWASGLGLGTPSGAWK